VGGPEFKSSTAKKKKKERERSQKRPEGKPDVCRKG
jgi:hypothetical protein